MNRHVCRILLFLGLVILLVCLPAQAAQGDQSGSSSAMSDPAAPASPAGSGAAPAEPAGNAPAPDPGRGVSSPSPATAGSGEPATGNAGGGLSATGTSTIAGPVNAPAGSGASHGPSVPAGGRADASTRHAERVEERGADPGAGAGGAADTVRGTGSLQATGQVNTAASPAGREQSGGSGRPAGMTGSPVGIAAVRFASGIGSSAIPGPGPGHGPQRQQHGPPAHAPGYPCAPAPAYPLPVASTQTRDESKEDSCPRQRSRRIGILSWLPEPFVPGSGASSVIPQALFPFNLLFFGGFRRISKKNVLEHEARKVTYQAIAATPGIDIRTLAGMTGINENTLRYHLDRLVATGKISCFTRPGIVRYFQNQGAYTQFEHRVFHYFRTDTPCGILRLLHRNPGLSRQHIADALMIAGPSVTRQMDNLIEDGIVENRFHGRSNHYYLTAGAAQVIGRVMSRTFAMHEESEAGLVAASAG